MAFEKLRKYIGAYFAQKERDRQYNETLGIGAMNNPRLFSQLEEEAKQKNDKITNDKKSE